jgi:hypothetical protein
MMIPIHSTIAIPASMGTRYPNSADAPVSPSSVKNTAFNTE